MFKIDVSKYATPEYSWKQMEIIKEGLIKKIDVSSYLNPKLTWREMKEIDKLIEKSTL
jgi:hypothetical protein